jgi:hypothetical protein
MPKKSTKKSNPLLDAALAEYAPYAIDNASTVPKNGNGNGNGNHPATTHASGNKLEFNYAQYLPSDLLSDSSSLPAKDEATAQKELASIEGKRRTVQVIRANLGLATDLEKAQGDYLDYQIAGANNDIKSENLLTKQTELIGAQLHTEIAGVRNSALKLELAGSKAELQADVDGWRQKLQAKRNKLALGEEKIKALNAQAKAEFPDYQPAKITFNPLPELAEKQN